MPVVAPIPSAPPTVLRPMRQTIRRKQIRAAQLSGEREAAAAISRILDRQHKALNRELRQANLRKRLAKSARDAGDPAMALYKDGGWAAWVETLTAGIRKALAPIIASITIVEVAYWQSRGKTFAPPPDDRLISDYEHRTGRSLNEIGNDTRTAVLAALAIWYAGNETLPDLIASLDKFFAPERATMIARTEAQFIAAQLALTAMQQNGVKLWNSDYVELGIYPCPECLDKAANDPHTLTEELPPYHPGCNCSVVYLGADGETI